MITVRKSEERGHFDHGWLDTYHTFSFSEYRDPRHMGFRRLRVLNDDRVAPGRGFGTHPHNDMEIVTVVLEGTLEHKDSMGNGTQIRPGDVQRMSAGTGITHSEFNPSDTEPVHLLQIWIFPETKGLTPSYEQKHFPPDEKQGRLRLVASRDGREGSVTIHQDAALFVTRLGPGERVEYAIAPGRHVWVHLATGSVRLNGMSLSAGDGAAVSEEQVVTLEGVSAGETLLFDLA